MSKEDKMPLLEVFNSNNKRIMSTHQFDCVYDKETIEALSASGYKFKVAGKSVPKTKVIETAKNILI